MNIDALKATGGNVDAAVDRLLNMLGGWSDWNKLVFIMIVKI